jgi:substrate-binding family protein
MNSLHRTLLLCSLLLLLPGRLLAEDLALGMSAAFSGPSRGLGIELYRGAMAYLEHINRAGGVHGKKIIMKAYDDGYHPIPAIQNTISSLPKTMSLSSSVMSEHLRSPGSYRC